LKNSLPEVIRTHVEERKIETAKRAAEMADEYILVDKLKVGFQQQSHSLKDKDWGRGRSFQENPKVGKTVTSLSPVRNTSKRVEKR